jgi:hypothetical protein
MGEDHGLRLHCHLNWTDIHDIACGHVDLVGRAKAEDAEPGRFAV